MKEVVRRKLITLSAYSEELEITYTNSLTAHVNALEEQEKYAQEDLTAEIIKLISEINKVETRKTLKSIRNCFFEKINMINKPLARIN